MLFTAPIVFVVAGKGAPGKITMLPGGVPPDQLLASDQFKLPFGMSAPVHLTMLWARADSLKAKPAMAVRMAVLEKLRLIMFFIRVMDDDGLFLSVFMAICLKISHRSPISL